MTSLSAGQFTPLVVPGNHGTSYVHYFPKNGNEVLIDGIVRQIPSGVGVDSGGVIADGKHCFIDLVANQALQPNTDYRVYTFMDGSTMRLNFSTAKHKESLAYGNEVHWTDQQQSLVGMVRLMKDGLISGTTAQQPTISWFNRGFTGLAKHFGNGQPMPRSSSSITAPPQAIDASGNVIPGYQFCLEFLTFGINGKFTQAFTVPNCYCYGTLNHSVTNGQAYVYLGNAAGQTLTAPSYWQHYPSHPAGNIFVAEVGAEPSNEGYAKVQLMMNNGNTGGAATMIWGTLYSSPLWS